MLSTQEEDPFSPFSNTTGNDASSSSTGSSSMRQMAEQRAASMAASGGTLGSEGGTGGGGPSYYRGGEGGLGGDVSRTAEVARADWALNTSKLTQGHAETQRAATSAAERFRRGGGGGGAGGVGAGGTDMIPPRWMPDEECLVCCGCHGPFDWARRRHHCRGCGKVFCRACTKHRALMPQSFGTSDPQRLCLSCYTRLLPLQEELVATLSNATQPNEISRGGIQPYLNRPVSLTLGGEIRKAAYTIRNFTRPGIVKDKSIPMELLTKARGLAFLTVAKAGFIFAGRIGSGLVVMRSDSPNSEFQWSAPTAIGTLGMSWGALVGGEITDFVLLLNTDAAVEAFTGRGQVTLGAEVGVAVGPLGRTGAGNVAVGMEGAAPVYSYSHSRGFFAGISLEGAIISTRPDTNAKFYGRDVSVKDLLTGVIAPPPAAQPLYDALAEAIPTEPLSFHPSPAVPIAKPYL